jgi:hypothetical protein
MPLTDPGAQAYMVAKPDPVSMRAALAALAFSGQMPPALLLLLAFDLGVASAATTRAYRALIRCG